MVSKVIGHLIEPGSEEHRTGACLASDRADQHTGDVVEAVNDRPREPVELHPVEGEDDDQTDLDEQRLISPTWVVQFDVKSFLEKPGSRGVPF